MVVVDRWFILGVAGFVGAFVSGLGSLARWWPW